MVEEQLNIIIDSFMETFIIDCDLKIMFDHLKYSILNTINDRDIIYKISHASLIINLFCSLKLMNIIASGLRTQYILITASQINDSTYKKFLEIGALISDAISIEMKRYVKDETHSNEVFSEMINSILAKRDINSINDIDFRKIINYLKPYNDFRINIFKDIMPEIVESKYAEITDSVGKVFESYENMVELIYKIVAEYADSNMSTIDDDIIIDIYNLFYKIQKCMQQQQ